MALTLDTAQFAANLVLSAAAMNRMADEARQSIVSRHLHGSMVDWLVINGERAMTDLAIHAEYDPSIRAHEIGGFSESIPDLTLLALTAMQAKRQDAIVGAILAVESISWWRILWLRLRGRPLVDLGG